MSYMVFVSLSISCPDVIRRVLMLFSGSGSGWVLSRRAAELVASHGMDVRITHEAIQVTRKEQDCAGFLCNAVGQRPKPAAGSWPKRPRRGEQELLRKTA